MKSLPQVLRSANTLTVDTVDYDYDCGDKRSYGQLTVRLTFKEDLPFKVLTFFGLVASGGGYECGHNEHCKLDDEQVTFDDTPEVEVPHYYAGVRTCQRWCERADETLREDFGHWLAGQLELAEELDG
jgi:hypothetical protein